MRYRAVFLCAMIEFYSMDYSKGDVPLLSIKTNLL